MKPSRKSSPSFHGWGFHLSGTHLLAVAIVLVACAVRALTLWHYGLGLSLHSDDTGYTDSAIRLLETGMLTYHEPNLPTVHMMPGISLLLAAVFACFGWHAVGLYAAKSVMILVGSAGVCAAYLLGREIWGPWAGLVGAGLSAIYPSLVLTDTLLLTEPPFEASFLFLLFFSVRHARTRSWSAFWGMVASYLVALMFRPTVALFPIVILLYHGVKRVPLRMLATRAALFGMIVVVVLSPWWIRNGLDFHRFIPLTEGSGDPLLLGTYQGHGFPQRPTYDEVIHQLKVEHPDWNSHTLPIYEEAVAKERLSEWWRTNPTSLLVSYLWQKPIRLWQDTFYWITIWKIPKSLLQTWQPRLLIGGLAGLLGGLIVGISRRWELGFILATLAYYTVLYSIYFAFGRYSEPLLPIVFVGVGIALSWAGSALAFLLRLRRTKLRWD
ncbi:4-amino-4-deoxy-L-arabinose transferase [Alicyclobacillus contaminans]|uniref:ArnT family glycosyltransferase n=1 Tax=Alicyclobacillus contaminans TaxID=392016 RepID=UPI0003FD03F3|nr:glycosyltransferase family 39 protein [Alicyclobacillus contaminans]GMA52134.1 4-amino-4-deoxy-L-arabinose transferase [Alicyclobacillus contaminans]